MEPWGTENTPRSDKICVSLQPNHWFTIPVLLEANPDAEGSLVVTIFYENMVGYENVQDAEQKAEEKNGQYEKIGDYKVKDYVERPHEYVK